MSEASEQWLEISRAWVDEQIEAQRVVDEAAWLRFREVVLGPLD
jgi:hypothetical protein